MVADNTLGRYQQPTQVYSQYTLATQGITYTYVYSLGERERAHLVVQLGQFFYIYISFDRMSGYHNVSTCFFFIVTFRHSTGHNTMLTSVAGRQVSQNDRESVVLLKLLNTISVAPSNIQLEMLRAVSANVRPFKFDVHYFDGGRIINGSHRWCFIALISACHLYTYH